MSEHNGKTVIIKTPKTSSDNRDKTIARDYAEEVERHNEFYAGSTRWAVDEDENYFYIIEE